MMLQQSQAGGAGHQSGCEPQGVVLELDGLKNFTTSDFGRPGDALG